MRQVTIDLKWPITHADKAINQVTMHPLTIGDRIKYPKNFGSRGEAENEITMLALMCDLPEQAICKIDQFTDYPKLTEVYLSFLGFPVPTSDGPAPSSPRKQKRTPKKSRRGKRRG